MLQFWVGFWKKSLNIGLILHPRLFKSEYSPRRSSLCRSILIFAFHLTGNRLFVSSFVVFDIGAYLFWSKLVIKKVLTWKTVGLKKVNQILSWWISYIYHVYAFFSFVSRFLVIFIMLMLSGFVFVFVCLFAFFSACHFHCFSNILSIICPLFNWHNFAY